MAGPTVHLNGSSPEYLVDTLRDAGDALGAALRALNDAAPNARDYYPQGDGAWKLALAEHEADMRALRDMRARYVVAMEHVHDQIDARVSREIARSES